MFGSSKTIRLLLLALVLPAPAVLALPSRLVLAVDGIAYRDLAKLQNGITRTNFWGGQSEHRAFTADEGYFPVSRMISTFPSLSDIAWTDIFGNRPLPGYQRIYFSHAANREIFTSGISTTMEYESQMDWQEPSGFLRGMGYLFPMHAYRREIREMAEHFWQCTNAQPNFYAYIRASDDAQHLDRNIVKMLCRLDGALQDLRARYRAQEGRELQIVILSDHGHNHAGRGERVRLRSFLEDRGYHAAKSINSPCDVVLPDGGIEDWAEINNAPGETEKIAQLLGQLKGVDLVAAVSPDVAGRFIILNSRGERAMFDWRPENNFFRYSPAPGDPLNYSSAIEALKKAHMLDSDGFASGDAWLAVTMTSRYPLALERIARGFTRNVLNPATILVSLDNHYVNDGWFTHQGSRLVTCRSTHGALDDLNSNGILLSNFQPTRDTSSDRVAAQFDNFAGIKNYRAQESGAELVNQQELSFTRIARGRLDRAYNLLPDGVCLRVWSPELAGAESSAPLDIEIKKASALPVFENGEQRTLSATISLAGEKSQERIYCLPTDLKLSPRMEYKMSCALGNPGKAAEMFELVFHTDACSRPVAY
jgi:hypothetical protein